MNEIPKKLNKCPIKEAIFEIRYTSKFPSEAVFGMIYSFIKDIFPKNSLKHLPVQQIPEQIRLQDENLKYQTLYRLTSGHMGIGIGPRAITFTNTGNYLGWGKWSDFFRDLLNKIEQSNVIDKVERIGLRYINIFDENILSNANINIKLDTTNLINETTNLRTEFLDSGFIKVLQIGNSVNIISNNKKFKGSIVDIDCIYNWDDDSFFDKYLDIINLAHKKEKELFFNLVKKDFIDKFDPEY